MKELYYSESTFQNSIYDFDYILVCGKKVFVNSEIFALFKSVDKEIQNMPLVNWQSCMVCCPSDKRNKSEIFKCKLFSEKLREKEEKCQKEEQYEYNLYCGVKILVNLTTLNYYKKINEMLEASPQINYRPCLDFCPRHRIDEKHVKKCFNYAQEADRKRGEYNKREFLKFKESNEKFKKNVASNSLEKINDNTLESSIDGSTKRRRGRPKKIITAQKRRGRPRKNI